MISTPKKLVYTRGRRKELKTLRIQGILKSHKIRGIL